jgi:osmotically-inducible protein OsmY
MKKQAVFFALACALAVTSSAALADRTAGQTIDDSTLATNTKMKLVDNSKVSAGDINIEVYKGHVQLIGYVESDQEKAAALAEAAKVEGVGKVVDSIIVMPGHRSLGRTIDDETIHGKVKLKLADIEGLGDAVAVVVMVRNGEVLLGGFVESRDTVASIGNEVRDIEGVEKIHNKLVAK